MKLKNVTRSSIVELNGKYYKVGNSIMGKIRLNGYGHNEFRYEYPDTIVILHSGGTK